MRKYTLGIDYGTLSARALLVDVQTGEEIATATYDYPHAVMTEEIPSGVRLGVDFALQDAADYEEALYTVISEVLRISKVNPKDIIGVGTDFTACTMIPIKGDGTPLSFMDEYKKEPHAYVKLWRHHAAEPEAQAITELAAERNEAWLPRYGGKISSEWELPKIWQVLREAPHIYEAMDHFIEGGDWITFLLTGELARNSCAAGYKGLWHKQDGHPSEDFLRTLDPKLEKVYTEKFSLPVQSIGTMAGRITKEAAAKTGLVEGTPVAMSLIDAHVAMPAAGITGPKQMLAIMGTSTCHILLNETEQLVAGICGVVEDGVYPDSFGYEAGQTCVGDHFAWLVKNGVPASYEKEAAEKNMTVHELLTEKSRHLKVGESGLLALDWWNGNRSILVDYDLTGVIIGMNLQTKAEEIYRALIEATAYGTRKIVETFREQGVAVEEFFACGGIAKKNSMAMQIYADVLNMPVYIVSSMQAPALGAAIFASVAAGEENGGYATMAEAAKIMGRVEEKAYYPQKEAQEAYEILYREYEVLHDYFGQGANPVLKRLKARRKELRKS